MAELWADAVVVWEHGPRPWLQCADVVVGVRESVPAALLWALAVLVSLPGCTAAVACHPGGEWVVSVWRVVTP